MSKPDIQRYYANVGTWGSMEPSQHGEWVKHEDHATVVDGLRADVEQARQRNNALHRRVQLAESAMGHWKKADWSKALPRSIARALLRWALQKATEENDELLADREALVAFARSAWPHSDAPFPRPDQMARILALLDHPEAQP